MAENLFEGTKLTLVCIVNGEPKSNQATFEIWRDDAVIETKKIELVNKRAEHEFTCPDVAPTVESYELTYEARVDDVNHGQDTVYRIWPSKLEIEAVDDADKPAGHAHFVIGQEANKQTRVRTRTKTGKAKAVLAEPGPFEQPKVETPWRLVTLEPAADDKRKFKAKLARGIQAKFVSPVAGKHKQYVNDRHGSLLRVEVGDADSQGEAGEKIYFKVTFGREGARTQPEPKVHDDKGDAKDVKPSPDKKVWTGHVELKKKNSTRKIAIELGLSGGDTCKVEIGGTTACDDATLELVNWRRLSYRLSYPDVMAGDLSDGQDLSGKAGKDLPVDLRKIAKDQLEAVFVEWGLAESVQWDTGKHPKLKAKAEFLKQQNRDRVILCSDTRKQLSGAEQEKPGDKRCVQLNLCDRILSPEGHVAKSVDATKPEVEIKDSDVYFPHVDALEKGSWEAKIADPDRYLHRPKAKFAKTVASDAMEAQVLVEATDDGGSCTLEFARSGLHHHYSDVQASHEVQLRALLDPILADKPRMRGNYEIALRLTMKTGNDRRTTREQAVKDWIKDYLHGQDKVPTHPGLDDDGKPRKGKLDLAKDYEVVTYRKLKITLPNEAAQLVARHESDTKCKIKIKVKARTCSGGNGSAKEGRALFKFRPDEMRGFAKTILHELGHMIGLAPVGWRPPSSGMPNKHVDNGGYYYSSRTESTPDDGKSGYRNIHNGHHCAAGCADTSAANFSQQKGTCIMWGSEIDTSAADPAFCPDCQSHIKSRNLGDLHTAWDTKSRQPDEF